jgi:hypothetical protein
MVFYILLKAMFDCHFIKLDNSTKHLHYFCVQFFYSSMGRKFSGISSVIFFVFFVFFVCFGVVVFRLSIVLH